MTDTTVEIEQSVLTGLDSLNKQELLAAAEQFGVEVKKTISKVDLVRNLAEDGVTLELIRGLNDDQADDDENSEDFVVEETAPVEEEDEEDLILVRMIRANNTYQIRGYTFKLDHPFALVKETDADYLIEHDGGFRMASPKEAREYYS